MFIYCLFLIFGFKKVLFAYKLMKQIKKFLGQKSERESQN